LIVQYDYVKQRWDFRAAGIWFPSRDLAHAHECAISFLAEQIWLEQQEKPDFEPDEKFIEEHVDEFEQMRQIQRYIAAQRAAKLRDDMEAAAWAALIVGCFQCVFRDKNEPNDLTRRLVELMERCVRDAKENAPALVARSALR
jgi:hypothetical protein